MDRIAPQILDVPPPEVLDLCGLRCPMPVLRTRKALAALPSGAVVEVRCTDPLAMLDVPHFVREAGHTLLAAERRGRDLVFTIRKVGDAP